MISITKNLRYNECLGRIKSRSCILGLTVLFLLVGWASSIQAETLNLNNTVLSQPPNYIQSVNYNGSNHGEYIGLIGGQVGGSSSQFFCFDINQSIYINTNYSVMAVNASYAGLAGLMGATPEIAGPGSSAADKTLRIEQAASVLQSQLSSVVFNNAASAGMQLAIWSILYNQTIPSLITDGAQFSAVGPIDSNVQNYANQFLGSVENFANPQFSDYNQIPFYVYLDGNNQIVGGIQVLGGVGVPEPGSYLSLCGFLTVIGLCAYRNNLGLRLS